MSKLCSNSEFLAFSGSSLHLSRNDGEDSQAELNCQGDAAVKSADKLLVDCSGFTACGTFLAVCFEKRLLLYNIASSEKKFVSSAVLDKTAMSVKFFNKIKSIVVAERNGCAAFYSYEADSLVKQSTCLGHNSMLTDVLITPNDDYIITADRDEKIRVSHYPNTYNIQSYCLGHLQFVSSLQFLPNNSDVLVSTSGDQTLRLWNYCEGKQLAVYEDDTPLMKCVSWCHGPLVKIVVQKYQSNELIVLSVGREDGTFKIEQLHKVSAPSVVFDITLFDSSVLFLVDDETAVRAVYEGENEKLQAFLERVNESVGSLVRHSPTPLFDLLFRREFNNIDAYFEKKKARIADKMKDS